MLDQLKPSRTPPDAGPNIQSALIPADASTKPFGPVLSGNAQITKAIASVMQEIDIVAKRGQNTFHHYRYARMEDVLRRLTPLLGKHGLVIFQDEIGRSMFDAESVIAISYEFTVAHESGEIWPQRLRQTGVSRCRDSKGGWDDKSLNKCHTAARKYFLLSLFQIPTGDESDADCYPDRNENAEPAKSAGTSAKAWTTKFLTQVRRAESVAALDALTAKNLAHLERLADVAPEQKKIADEAVARRRGDLVPASKSLPPLIQSAE